MDYVEAKTIVCMFLCQRVATWQSTMERDSLTSDLFLSPESGDINPCICLTGRPICLFSFIFAFFSLLLCSDALLVGFRLHSLVDWVCIHHFATAAVSSHSPSSFSAAPVTIARKFVAIPHRCHLSLVALVRRLLPLPILISDYRLFFTQIHPSLERIFFFLYP